MAPLAFAILMVVGSVLFSTPVRASEREKTLCGKFREPFAFWIWSKTAPDPDDARIRDLRDIEFFPFRAGDGVELGGFKIRARDTEGALVEPRGYLLIAQGNAVLADQMAPAFYFFAQYGFDVYVFDFRGYGRSKGKRRLGAILTDYSEIVTSLSDEYNESLLYGFSFGGVVVMNLMDRGHAFDRVVVDSAPSRISTFGCPKNLDPVRHVSHADASVMIVTGQRDQVLSAKLTRELRERGKARGARTVDSQEFAHPFMDANQEAHQKRMDLISGFLLDQVTDR